MSMVIQIYNLSGSLCSLDADPNWTVVELKRALAKVVRVPPRQQRLLCGISQLRDSDVLAQVLPGCEVTYARVIASAEAEEWIAKVRQNGRVLWDAPDHIRRDHEVILAAMQDSREAIELADAEVQKDRDFALAVAAWDGECLLHLAAEFRSDDEVVLAAVRQNPKAIMYASDDLQSSMDFLKKAVDSSKGLAFKYVSFEMQNDLELAIAAVSQNWLLLSFVPGYNDRDIVYAAVSNHGCALEFAAVSLRADRELVELALMRSQGSALKWASQELRADRDLVLSAVQMDGTVLQWVSDILQGDREIVLEAVRQNGNMLKFASAHLRSDREIVQAAAEQAGVRVLRYASKDLEDELTPHVGHFDLFDL